MFGGLSVLLIACQIWLAAASVDTVLIEGSCAEHNGGCDQECIDRGAGGLYCDCSIPGYQLQDDGTSCEVVEFCEALTPNAIDGILNCRYTASTNGWICFIMCDDGYFFVSGENDYITCGIETNWKWSHQLVNVSATLPTCTKEFFVDTKLVVHYDYVLPEGGCSNLGMFTRQLSSVIQQGIQGLEACDGRCWLPSVYLDCQHDQPGTTLQVTAGIYFINGHPEPVGPDCGTSCRILNTREILGQTMNMLIGVEGLVLNIGVNITGPTGPETPHVDKDSFTYESPNLLCKEPGRVLTSKFFCVPCAAGTYLASSEDEMCTPCPVGTYTRYEGQVRCGRCPMGSTTATTGASHSTECSVRVS